MSCVRIQVNARMFKFSLCHSPFLCLTAFVEFHLKGSGAGAGKDGSLVTAVLIVVRRLHVPGSQDYRLLWLLAAFLVHLKQGFLKQ